MKVEIYGTEQCTYCKMAVSLCKSKSIDYDYINVREGTNLQALQERMGSEVRTVPQIFTDGKYLPGGYTSLQKELANN